MGFKVITYFVLSEKNVLGLISCPLQNFSKHYWKSVKDKLLKTKKNFYFLFLMRNKKVLLVKETWNR